MEIGYLSDPVPDYCKAVAAAANYDELAAVVRAHELIAGDAVDALSEPFDWQEWRRGIESEKCGKFAGEDWAGRYGAIPLPEIMLRVTMIAGQYKVPFGCAYIQACDAGLLAIVDGRACWQEQPEAPK